LVVGLDVVRLDVMESGFSAGGWPERSQLVSARSRVKNEVHAVLVRCLK
jgi:hypothetical protein